MVYAPSPKKALCPMESSPVYPAARFSPLIAIA